LSEYFFSEIIPHHSGVQALMLPLLFASSISWAVDVAPTCRRFEATVLDETRRACSAAGTCEIVDTSRRADGSLRLTCTDQTLTVAARRGDRELWSLTLDGAPEDRVRKAAVWIARSDAPQAEGPSLAKKEVVAGPSAAERPPAKASEKWLGFGASVELMEVPFRPPVALGLNDTYGVHVNAMFRLTGDLYAGPVLAFERGTYAEQRSADPVAGVAPEGHDETNARVAARVGWGAPWGMRTFGAYVDLGYARAWYPVEGDTRSRNFLFASPTLVAQLPLSDVRPFVSAGGDVVLDERIGFAVGAHAGLGVAWSAL
jgi:hypothetical protein